MKNKLTTPDEFAALINDGDEIMYGGFLGVGTPTPLWTQLSERESRT